jgi:hypothetical protein
VEDLPLIPLRFSLRVLAGEEEAVEEERSHSAAMAQNRGKFAFPEHHRVAESVVANAIEFGITVNAQRYNIDERATVLVCK